MKYGKVLGVTAAICLSAFSVNVWGEETQSEPTIVIQGELEPRDWWQGMADKIQETYSSDRQGEIIFYGASNFARWENMEEDMKEYKVQNHAFGGSIDADLVYFSDQLLFPYNPSIVFFQTGSNDYVELTGTDEEKVQKCMDYKKQMFEAFHERLPETKFVVMSGLLLPGRSEYVELTEEINQQLKEYADQTDYIEFVNADDLTYDGSVFNETIFEEDLIHLNHEGQLEWYENYIKPEIEKVIKENNLENVRNEENMANADDDFGTEGNYRHITKEDNCSVLLEHPAFKECGFSILPVNFAGGSVETMGEHTIEEILEKTGWIASEEPIMNSLNYIIDKRNEGGSLFYNYYTDEEIAEDETKAKTGIVYYESEKDAPFVVVTAGGGYDFYTGMAEAYPIAYEFQQRGYNVFILIYRVKAAKEFPEKISIAMDDYDKAMEYIFANIGENGVFQVNPDKYAVCGFSAGARLAKLWGGDADKGWFALDLPKPEVMFLQYGGHLPENYGTYDCHYDMSPAVYALTAENDKTVTTEEIRNMISLYEDAGIKTYLDVRENGGHGFGLGTGTAAEGWLDVAVNFWKELD